MVEYAGGEMSSLPSFEHLLPRTDHPAEALIRDRLVEVLDSKGEILPFCQQPARQALASGQHARQLADRMRRYHPA